MHVYGSDARLVTQTGAIPYPIAAAPCTGEVTVRWVQPTAPAALTPRRTDIGDSRSRWHRGEAELAAMRSDYESGVLVTRIMRTYRIRSTTLHRLAVKHGWERMHARAAAGA